jgi:NDP-sugar pyrophosphorylase family protein
MQEIEHLREVAERNGGGKVTPFVTLSRQATIEKNAQAFDHAEILNEGKVRGESIMYGYSKVLDEATILDTTLAAHARVGGKALVEKSVIAGTSDIRGSKAWVYRCQVADNVIIAGDCRVEESTLGANTRVLDRAKLYNVITGRGDIGETYIICGDAELAFPVPLELYPGTRVHEGLWTRPPKVIETPYFYTVEGVGDRVQIGCMNHYVNFWLKHGKEVLLNYGLPEDVYGEFYDAMVEMKKFKKEMKSPNYPNRRQPDDSSVV